MIFVAIIKEFPL